MNKLGVANKAQSREIDDSTIQLLSVLQLTWLAVTSLCM
jgi:hypothetical protein